MSRSTRLAIFLSLIACLIYPGLFENFRIKLKRTYLYINPNGEENTYMYVNRLFAKTHKDGIATQRDGDVPFSWDGRLTNFTSKNLNTTVIFDYGWRRFITNIGPCRLYPIEFLENLSLDIFNKIMANYGRPEQCPINTTSILASVVLGQKLSWERKMSYRVYFNSTVEITLKIDQRVYTFDHPTDTRSTPHWHNTVLAIYKGKFNYLTRKE